MKKLFMILAVVSVLAVSVFAENNTVSGPERT